MYSIYLTAGRKPVLHINSKGAAIVSGSYSARTVAVLRISRTKAWATDKLNEKWPGDDNSGQDRGCVGGLEQLALDVPPQRMSGVMELFLEPWGPLYK